MRHRRRLKENAADLLKRLAAVLSESGDQKASDETFFAIDDLLAEDRFGEVDEVLEQACNDEVSTVVLTALLAVTFATRKFLTKRNTFYDVVRQSLEDDPETKGQSEDILFGLRDTNSPKRSKGENVMRYSPEQALERAVNIACQSPCEKSKRGVVIWHPDLFDILCANNNHPPQGFVCDGSAECRANCGKHCVHAEMAALLDAKQGVHGYHMLHVKVVDGKAVPSGLPSCAECSKHILEAGIRAVWLLHEEGLCAYRALEFHEMSLREKKLPVIR